MTSPGQVLEAARRARGQSLEEAAGATRIRRPHLAALEAERWDEVPAPAYVRGYLRTYAAYLGLDAEELLSAYERDRAGDSRGLAIKPLTPLVRTAGPVLTAPAAGAVGLVLLVLAFAGYIYHQVDSLRAPALVPAPAATMIPSPLAPATPNPSPTPARVQLRIDVTDTVWINVIVDGKPQFADSGRILQPGDSMSFEGSSIKVTSGRAAATLVTLDGKPIGALGNGVVTREFGQT